ncbi:hypothetical protein KY310_01910 [Candidatus Woesearchaeota archaeon]|nr:hypothetical protein [Candidatus Woesearchaeota archaeon]
MKINKLLVYFFFSFMLVTAAAAHQPRIVTKELTQIQNPEISQAFYGILDNSPEYFEIKSAVPFKLYVGLLVPDVEYIDTDVSAKIISNEQVLFQLNGSAFEWTYFYEEFAGDSYYKGPEKEIEVSPGTYSIAVFSPDNQGKYVLVVGKKEEFPLKEWVNTFVTLPKLKKFFDKSPFTAFFNLIGLSLLILIALAAVITFVVYKILKKKYARR